MKTSLWVLAIVLAALLVNRTQAFVYKTIDLRVIESALKVCEDRGNLKRMEVIMSDMVIIRCGNGQKFRSRQDGMWNEISSRRVGLEIYKNHKVEVTRRLGKYE